MRLALLAALLLVPALVDAQAKKASRDFERFDVSGLPAEPTNNIERNIFLLLRVHRKGDLEDATRIHMLLSQYYREIGDVARADNCARDAAAAWNAKSDVRPTAGAVGKPPFGPQLTFERTYVYTDELQVAHTWEFYLDGTFKHTVGRGTATDPNETGWYTRRADQIRLWQLKPSVDRTVAFQLLGPDGVEGAVLDGVRMAPGR